MNIPSMKSGGSARSLITRTFALFCLLLISSMTVAQTRDSSSIRFWFDTASDGPPIVQLHYFYSPTCEHCRRASPVLQEMEDRLPWLNVQRHTVANNASNARLYYQLGEAVGKNGTSTPGFAFCGRVESGFDSARTTGRDLERALTQCFEERAAGGVPEAVKTFLADPNNPEKDAKSQWWHWALPLLLVCISLGYLAVVQLRTKQQAQQEATRKAERKQKRAARRGKL